MRKIFLLVGCMLLLALSAVWAQTKTITGKITDANGNPIPSITVRIKGSKTGTSAETDGSFKLSAANNATLIFSGIGFESKEVNVSNTSSVNVQLDQDMRALSEIVVTGVGVATSKRKLGISVESVTAEKLPATPTASIGDALVGKIPGAQISTTNGTPGSAVSILLRGVNTINRGTAPMIIMDGIEMGASDMNAIDLNTIERVEVIQGAAAATIYGAQGANGVIQLFTKKGKNGKVNIDFSSSVTRSTALNVGGLRKARLHAFGTDASNNVIGASGLPLTFDPVKGYTDNVVYDALNPTSQLNKAYDKNLQYHDHFAEFFQAANTFNNSLVISGGKEKMDFAFTGSNSHQESNFKNNGYFDRSNFTSNIGFEILKNLRFRSITQLAYTRNTINSYDRNIIYAINNTRPFADYEFKDPDGNYLSYYGDAPGVNGANPNYWQQYTHRLNNKVDVLQNFNLNYKLNHFVELDAKYGLNYQRIDKRNIFDNQTLNKNAVFQGPSAAEHVYKYNDADLTGEINNLTYNTIFQNFITTATVRTDFEKDFHIKIPIKTTTQVAFDYRNSKYKQFITYALGLPTYTPFTATSATNFIVPSANLNEPDDYTLRNGGDYTEPFVTYGYLLNQRFEYGDIAGISGGFRSDYSSAFGRGSKPFTFPRGDAYLRLSAMNFWADGKIADIIPELKFRAAYGQAGIQPKPFDRYVTLTTRTQGASNAFFLQSNQSNPDLNVEVSKELEIGTDLSLNVLKGDWLKTINLSATYWDRKTDNAIFQIDVAPSSGSGKLLDNAFGLGSHGIQASLNATILGSQNFTWNFTTNFGKQLSRITSVTGPPVIITSSAGSSNYVLKAGEKIGQLYGFLGLHQVDALKPNGTPFIAKDQQANYTLASNGWVVEKASKLPYFTPDQYSFGDPNPKFNMSFINDVSFKGMLTLSVQWDWVYGSHLYNQTKEWMYRDGIHSDYEMPITIDGQTGAWTAFYRGVYAQVSRNGTKNYFYEDASFFRLRNIAVAFDFGKAFHLKSFQKLQLVLSGRNLLTSTKYTGMDPETSSGNTTGFANSAFDRGVDHNTMPNLKSYQAGINVGF